MKYLIILLLSYLLIGCNDSSKNNIREASNKIIETESETAECIIGEWIPETNDPKNIVVSYQFLGEIAKTKDHKYSGRFKIFYYKQKWVRESQNAMNRVTTDEIIEKEGKWYVKNPGEVIAKSGRAGITKIKLINCSRLVAREEYIFLKK